MELYLLTTITDRRQLPRFVSLYQDNGIAVGMVALGHGTYSDETQALLMGSSEKAVCFSIATMATWRLTKRLLRRELQIDAPGVGVAFIVPLSSIGGRRELGFLLAGQEFQRGEESVLKGTDREMLVVISEQGYNELVMDAARAAGAYGGTVIRARGTGTQQAEQFLGITLASEKDMTFIVTKTASRDRIMQSIMFKAGLATPAKSIVFSLPVTDTAGLRLVDEDDSGEAEPKENEGTKEGTVEP